MMLRTIIERLYELPPDSIDRDDALKVIAELKGHLNTGNIRAASPAGDGWQVHAWVKKGIILAFRIGRLTGFPADGPGHFFDKDTMRHHPLSAADEVRLVPGGSAIRDGAFLGKGVVVMPPSYINIGAWVDAGTMIDSHGEVQYGVEETSSGETDGGTTIQAKVSFFKPALPRRNNLSSDSAHHSLKFQCALD